MTCKHPYCRISIIENLSDLDLALQLLVKDFFQQSITSSRFWIVRMMAWLQMHNAVAVSFRCMRFKAPNCTATFGYLCRLQPSALICPVVWYHKKTYLETNISKLKHFIKLINIYICISLMTSFCFLECRGQTLFQINLFRK